VTGGWVVASQKNTTAAVNVASIQYHFVIAVRRPKERESAASWGCVSAIDSNGRTIWIVDAHRDDGKRYVVHAEELLMEFQPLLD